MTRFAWEVTLHWAAVAFYIAATAVCAHAFLFKHPKRVRIAVWAMVIGLVPHAAALVIRWVASGHGPYMLKYEVLSSNAWIAVVMVAVFLWRRPTWSIVGLVVLPCAFLMLAIGLFTNPEMRDLPPTLRSVWLVFHVLFNKLAAGAFLLSVGTACGLLFKKRRSDRGEGGGGRLPDLAALEAYTVRFAGFGFVFWTITIVAGSIWANESWNRYWGWDPIETWSLVTWLGYGIFLHVRLFFRPSPAKVAWGAIGCFVLSVLTIFILPFAIPSLHAAYFQ